MDIKESIRILFTYHNVFYLYPNARKEWTDSIEYLILILSVVNDIYSTGLYLIYDTSARYKPTAILSLRKSY